MKPQQHFEALLKEATALAEGVSIKSEEGRILLNLIRRMLEVQIHGEPKTKATSRHHA